MQKTFEGRRPATRATSNCTSIQRRVRAKAASKSSFMSVLGSAFSSL